MLANEASITSALKACKPGCHDVGDMWWEAALQYGALCGCNNESSTPERQPGGRTREEMDTISAEPEDLHHPNNVIKACGIIVMPHFAMPIAFAGVTCAHDCMLQETCLQSCSIAGCKPVQKAIQVGLLPDDTV